jgi:hypothetical protein
MDAFRHVDVYERMRVVDCGTTSVHAKLALQPVYANPSQELVFVRVVGLQLGISPRQQPKLSSTELFKLISMGRDLHSGGNWRRAPSYGPRVTLDLDQAKAAGADGLQPRIVAEGRNIDAGVV